MTGIMTKIEHLIAPKLFYYQATQPRLPHDDPDASARAGALEAARADYRYNLEKLPPIPLLDSVPERDRFSGRYIAERAGRTLQLLPDIASWKLHLVYDPLSSVEGFAAMFDELPEPRSTTLWRDDEFFAAQRLCGANPMVIERIDHPDRVPFELATTPAPPQGWEAALASGRLFLADYRGLDFVKGGAFEDGQMRLPTPVALFGWRDATAESPATLVPLAIQLAPDRPVLTPGSVDPSHWLLAKTCVQTADANHHEMSSHLSRTHFVMEPFGIATPRQLAPAHPVRLLLEPHLRFLMCNNELGRTHLINEGGIVDHLLAGTLAESLEIVTRAYDSWSLDGFALPAELERRGVADADALPEYAYRDDATLLWDAIGAFVDEYLALYYAHDAAVAADPELQAWAAELADPAQGRVKGMPSHLTSRGALAAVVQTVIFTCGPQHSAVNYAQYDHMGFIPNMPLATYGDIPHEAATDHTTLLSLLPSKSRAEQQLEIMDELTSYRFDRFGHYPDDALVDAAVAPLLAKFRARLDEIETEINERNSTRRFIYPYLLPSNVLNSISI